MKSRVFLVQEAVRGEKFDLRDARRFGDIHTILDSTERPMFSPGKCLKKLKEAFQDLTEEDYVLTSGSDQVAIFLAGMAIMATDLKKVKYLRWERAIDSEGKRTGKGYYVSVTVPVKKLFTFQTKPKNSH